MGNSLEHVQKIMNGSMESLIHHFKLVTEGFRVPAGQVYTPIESPRGELGAHVVSDGGTRPYRVHLREPSFINLQSTAALSIGGMIADVIASVGLDRPGDGRSATDEPIRTSSLGTTPTRDRSVTRASRARTSAPPSSARPPGRPDVFGDADARRGAPS